MDIVKDYTSKTIKLKSDYEGEVTATLVTSNFNVGNRKCVLYLHGYVDYFFHAHVGKTFDDHNFDFYALDLRKYGRSLLPHQHAHFCEDISEYYEEMTIAIRQIHESSNGEVFLLGHSTGGLIASNYMNDGQERDLIKGLLLNSPFLGFNQSKFQISIVCLTAKLITKLFPYAKVNGALSPAYAQSIHKDFYGEWDYNLEWKPVTFLTYYAWLLAVQKGHKSIVNSNIKVPVLVMHASASADIPTFSEEAMLKDIVLNVDNIKRIGAKLGQEVTVIEIENAQHDIFLSQKTVREKAFDEMFIWLSNMEAGK